ncbi:hypothetical protein [Streptomyces sp. NPDC059092]|uniref:hypothetical protein n=1 Tax=Streptomyces sp. NPDC059092 TaxID=3346725 RepID=UPI0036CBB69F
MGPLLFLDVDGPLNPWKAQPERRPAGYETHRMKPPSLARHYPGKPWAYVKPLRVWLNPQHGAALASLGFSVVWATTWMGEARDFIAPAVGLPDLPFVDFGDRLAGEGPNGTHWKTETLVAYAAGRDFAWADDEITDADREFVAARHEGRALLRWVDPRLGLREPDFVALAEFAGAGSAGA